MHHSTDALIDLALAEDLGLGDVTTEATVSPDEHGEAEVIAKQALVLAGVEVFTRVFARVDARVEVEACHGDAARLQPGDVALKVRGPLAALLTGERLALNFLMHLSGVATATSKSASGRSSRMI